MQIPLFKIDIELAELWSGVQQIELPPRNLLVQRVASVYTV